MSNVIGRITHGTNDTARSYRFPYPLLKTGLQYYIPSPHSNVTQRLSRRRSATATRVQALNHIARQLRDIDVRFISSAPRSRYLEITLVNDDRYIDYGNRWERIERLLEDTFGLAIREWPDRRPKRR